MTVSERFHYIFSYYDINAAKFSEKIGVQRSAISHILTGRNFPSYELLNKIVATFPNVNLNWLITGKGDKIMESVSLKDSEVLKQGRPIESKLDPQAFIGHNNSESTLKTSKTVEQIIFIYNDKTFDIFAS